MKGIDFTPDMHRAIREGRKCMTRRVVKCPKGHPYPSEWQLHGKPVECAKGWVWNYGWDGNDNPIDYPLTQKYKVGDRVFVRETWSKVPTTAYRHSREEDGSGVPHQVSPCGYYWAVYKDGWDRSAPTWKSGRFMPEWASRTILEVTGVRVERVQEISADDARAEGITDGGCLNCGCPEPCGCKSPDPCAIESFGLLWESIRGPGAWLRNDWVWVYEFKVVQNA